MNKPTINQKLIRLFESANNYLNSDPNASILKIGIFGELLTYRIFQEEGIIIEDQDQHQRLLELWQKKVISGEVASYLHQIRQFRNWAIHVNSEGDFSEDTTVAQEAIKNAKLLIERYLEITARSSSSSRQPQTPPPVPANYRRETVKPPQTPSSKAQPRTPPPVPANYRRETVNPSQSTSTQQEKPQSNNYTLEEYQKAREFLAKLAQADDPYPLNFREYNRISELADFFNQWKKTFDDEKHAAIEYLRFMGEDNLI